MISLFTLHWNKKDTIKELKNSLLPCLEGLEWTWHIRDNASSDGSVEEIESWKHPNINLIKYKDNKSNYAQGMNSLFYQSGAKSGDLIFTLNNDIVFRDTNSLKNMIKIISEDSEVGQVGAKLNYSNSPDILQHVGVLFHGKNGLPFHFRAGVKEEARDRSNRLFPVVTGALSLTTADIYKETKHDETYFWQFEDVDLSMQIAHNLKKKIVYCGETNVSHAESLSLKTNPVHRLFQRNNALHFLQKWKNQIDPRVNQKYIEDPTYNLYKKELKK